MNWLTTTSPKIRARSLVPARDAGKFVDESADCEAMLFHRDLEAISTSAALRHHMRLDR